MGYRKLQMIPVFMIALTRALLKGRRRRGSRRATQRLAAELTSWVRFKRLGS